MSYEPTNWKNGDIVTADKLNKLERGVASAGGGALIVTEDAETGALNKTWKEIHDAAPLVWVEEDGGYFALGAVLGAMLRAYGGHCIGAWRGAFFFLLMLFAGYLWYPLFFVRQNPLFALLVLLAVVACAALCALQWQGISLIAGVVMWVHVLWLIYMLILQLVCLFGV